MILIKNGKIIWYEKQGKQNSSLVERKGKRKGRAIQYMGCIYCFYLGHFGFCLAYTSFSF